MGLGRGVGSQGGGVAASAGLVAVSWAFRASVGAVAAAVSRKRRRVSIRNCRAWWWCGAGACCLEQFYCWVCQRLQVL